MALTDNKIGIHRFISLTGQQIPPAQTKVIKDRDGVNGSEFILTGTKGRPFVLVSVVDCEDYTDAHNLLNTYTHLIDDDALEVVQGGVSSETNNYRCVVLDVEGQPQVIRGAVGNLLSSSAGAMLTARWTLCAVPMEA